VGERLECAEGVSVGYGCWIGDDVSIGSGSIVHPLVYVGDGVRIGDDCEVYPHVVLYPGTELGSRVTVHAGTVIGSDGFGYVSVGGELVKVPHIGKVVIEDDVEIGANVTIDRAKTGSTRIGRGTKIDNLVQLAHNVKTGQRCIIVAQVGLAGSVELGEQVTLAGQVGVNSHVRIGDGAVVGAGAGVFGDLEGGGTYSGFPARRHREHLRAQAALLRLPEMREAVAGLSRQVADLKEQVARLSGEQVEADPR
jgi:UDP-3-O-[3-hydroxymyristoyl] glucosamine N-acyltransferase